MSNNKENIKNKCMQICFCILIISIIVIAFDTDIIHIFAGIATTAVSYIIYRQVEIKEKSGGFVEHKEIFKYSKQDIESEKILLLAENLAIQEILDKWDGFENVKKPLSKFSKDELKNEINDLLAVSKTTFSPYKFRVYYIEKINDYLSGNKSVITAIQTRGNWTPNSKVFSLDFVQNVRNKVDMKEIFKKKLRLLNSNYILNTTTPTDVRTAINDLDKQNFINSPIDRQVLKLLYSILPHEQNKKTSTMCTDDYVSELLPKQSSSANLTTIRDNHRLIIDYFEKCFKLSFEAEEAKFGDQTAYVKPVMKTVECHVERTGSADPQKTTQAEDDMLKTLQSKKRLSAEEKKKLQTLLTKKEKYEEYRFQLNELEQNKKIQEEKDKRKKRAALIEKTLNMEERKFVVKSMNEINKKDTYATKYYHYLNLMTFINIKKLTNDDFINMYNVDLEKEVSENIDSVFRYIHTSIGTLISLIDIAVDFYKDLILFKIYRYTNHFDISIDYINKQYNVSLEPAKAFFDKINDNQMKRLISEAKKDTDSLFDFKNSELTINDVYALYELLISDDFSEGKVDTKKLIILEINNYNKKYRKQEIVKSNDDLIENLMSTQEKYVNKSSIKNLTLEERELASSLGRKRFITEDTHETQLTGVKSKETLAPSGTFENKNENVAQLVQDAEEEQIDISKIYNSRNFALRTPKISLLPIITGKEDANTNAFIDAIKANKYEEYYRLEYKNLMEGLNDIHLRLLVHYKTNLDRLDELNSINDSCMSIVSKVGEKVKALESEILDLRDSSKDIEILHKIKESSKLLLSQKTEAEVKLRQLEEKYENLRDSQTESGGAAVSTLKHNLDNAERLLAEEKEKHKETNRKNLEMATKLGTIYSDIEAVREMKSRKEKQIDELDVEIKNLKSDIVKHKDTIEDISIQLNLYKLKESEMERAIQRSNKIIFSERDNDMHITQLIDFINELILKSKKSNNARNKRRKLDIQRINNSIDKIEESVGFINSSSEQLDTFADILMKKTQSIQNYSSEKMKLFKAEVFRLKKRFNDTKKELMPFFVSNGGGFRYLKEHINKLQFEKKQLIKSLEDDDLVDLVKNITYGNVKQFNYDEENKDTDLSKNNKIHNRIKTQQRLFEIDRELYHQTKIVSRFNRFVDIMFTNLKKSNAAEDIDININTAPDQFISEYKRLIGDYTNYIFEHNKLKELNTTLLAKNKVIESQLNEIKLQRKNLEFNVNDKNKDAGDIIKTLSEEITRLKDDLDSYYNQNKSSIIQMKEVEINTQELIKENKDKDTQILKLLEEVEDLKKKNIENIQLSIDEQRKEYHNELDEIVKLLGSDNKDWDYENVDFGNIKKKQLFIISKIRELLKIDSVREEAEFELEELKKEHNNSLETIRQKDSIIQELKEGIQSGNVMLDSLDSTKKKIVSTYTEEISKENENMKIKVNELEEINKKQSEEIKSMISKLENTPLINSSKSDNSEINRIIGTMQNAYIHMSNPLSENKDTIIINLLKSISSKGLKRLFIHNIINSLFSEEGKQVLREQIFNMNGNELVDIMKSVFIKNNKNILSEKGIDSFLSLFEYGNDYVDFDESVLLPEIISYTNNIFNERNKSSQSGAAEEEDDFIESGDEIEVKQNIENNDIDYENDGIIDYRDTFFLKKGLDLKDLYSTESIVNISNLDDEVVFVFFMDKLGMINHNSDAFNTKLKNKFKQIESGSILNSKEFIIDCIIHSIDKDIDRINIHKDTGAINGKLVRSILDEKVRLTHIIKYDYDYMMKFIDIYFNSEDNIIFKSDELWGLLLDKSNIDGDWVDGVTFNTIKNTKYYLEEKEKIISTYKSLDNLEKEITSIERIISDKIPSIFSNITFSIGTHITDLKSSIYLSSEEKDRLKRLNSDLIEKTKEYDTLSDKLNTFTYSKNQKKIDETQIAIKRVNRIKANLEKDIKTLENKISTSFKNKLEEYKNSRKYQMMYKRGNQPRDIEISMEIITNELVNYINVNEKNMKSGTELRESSFKMKDDIAFMLSNIVKVKDSISSNNILISEISNQIDAAIEKSKELVSKYGITSKDNDSMKLELSLKNEKIEKLTSELKNANSLIVNSKKKVSSVYENLERLQSDKNRLILSLNESTNKKEQYYSNINQSKERIDELDLQINNISQILKSKNKIPQEFYNMIDNVLKEIKNTEILNTVSKIKNRVFESLDECEQLRIEIELLNKEKDIINSDINEFVLFLKSKDISVKKNKEVLPKAEIEMFINQWNDIISSNKILYDYLKDLDEINILDIKPINNNLSKISEINKIELIMEQFAKKEYETKVIESKKIEVNKYISEKEKLTKNIKEMTAIYNKIQSELTLSTNNIISIVSKIDEMNIESKQMELELEKHLISLNIIKTRYDIQMREKHRLQNAIENQSQVVNQLAAKISSRNKEILDIVEKVSLLHENNKFKTKKSYDDYISIIDKTNNYFSLWSSDITNIDSMITTISNMWNKQLISNKHFAEQNKMLEKQVLDLSKQLEEERTKNVNDMLSNKQLLEDEINAIKLFMNTFSIDNRKRGDIEIIKQLTNNIEKVDSGNVIDYITAKKDLSLEIIKMFNNIQTKWDYMQSIISGNKGLVNSINDIISLCSKYEKDLNDITNSGVSKEAMVEELKQKSESLMMDKEYLENTINSLKKEKELISKDNKENKEELDYLRNVINAINEKVKDNMYNVENININLEEIKNNSNIAKAQLIKDKYSVDELYTNISNMINILVKQNNNKNRDTILSLNSKIDGYQKQLDYIIQTTEESIKTLMNDNTIELLNQRLQIAKDTLNKYEESIMQTLIKHKKSLEINSNILTSVNLSIETVSYIKKVSSNYANDIVSMEISMNNIINLSNDLKEKYINSLKKVSDLENNLSIELKEKEKAIKDFNAVSEMLDSTRAELEKASEQNLKFSQLRETAIALSQLNNKILEHGLMVEKTLSTVESLKRTALKSIDTIYSASRAINQLAFRTDSIISIVSRKNIIMKQIEAIGKLNKNNYDNLYNFIDKNINDLLTRQTIKNKLMAVEVNSIINKLSKISIHTKNSPRLVKPEVRTEYITVVEEIYIPTQSSESNNYENAITKTPIIKKKQIDNSEYSKYINSLKKIKI